MSTRQMWRFAAPIGVRECLEYARGNATFTSRDVFEAVPEIKAVYETSKTLGDRLGQGIADHGLGLHKSPAGGHLRCRENATLFILGACSPEFVELRKRIKAGESPDDVLCSCELDAAAVEELVNATGFDSIEELSNAIRALPSLEDLGVARPDRESPVDSETPDAAD